MAMKEGQADRSFFRRRFAIAGRPPVYDIGDVNLLAIEADGGQHAIEQLTGSTDKWQAQAVFIGPGRFADQHDTAGWTAIGEHQIGRVPFQLTTVESTQCRAKLLERLAGSGNGFRICRGYFAPYGGLIKRPRDRSFADHWSGAGYAGLHRRWSNQAVDRSFANGFIGPALEQPLQSGASFFSGQITHWIMV